MEKGYRKALVKRQKEFKKKDSAELDSIIAECDNDVISLITDAGCKFKFKVKRVFNKSYLKSANENIKIQ